MTGTPFPDRSGFRFFTPLKVRFNETDLQGHVNFGQFYFYFDVGLTEYMDAIGYSYMQLLADNSDLIYAESHCNYRSPARWPETLRIYARLGSMGRRSLRFEFEARAEPEDRLVADGHIVAIVVGRGGFDPAPIPNGLRQAAEAFEDRTFDGDPSARA